MREREKKRNYCTARNLVHNIQNKRLETGREKKKKNTSRKNSKEKKEKKKKKKERQEGKENYIRKERILCKLPWNSEFETVNGRSS